MSDQHVRRPVLCGTCGSTDVARDAWAVFDSEQQAWVLGNVFDHAHCHSCDGETTLTQEPALSSNDEALAATRPMDKHA